MPYPKLPSYQQLLWKLNAYSDLKYEYGARGIKPVLAQVERAIQSAIHTLRSLPVEPELARREPNALPAIRKLRPAGPRRLCDKLPADYEDRLTGAMLARFAGCTLGAIVEGWPVEAMRKWAEHIGDAFPPVNYWSRAKDPTCERYITGRGWQYTRRRMDGVPVDDDVTYTLLGLMIAEDHGPDFTIADVGAAWLKYLPMACTAEEIALANLRAGVPAAKAGEKDNPFVQWIGADIRSDPWGYMAPGWPEMAAELAYRDAFISHRRNGIYGEMFFSAVIAAAFAVDSAEEAIRIGLTEIPRDCLLARDVRWALRTAKDIADHRDARSAVDKRFGGMSHIHTNNNACLTIFGLLIGGRDVTEVLSQTVAMGMDNDCTAATAGSIVGALVGESGVPARWTKPFHNKVQSYLIGRPKFTITGLTSRFTKQARRVIAP